MSKQYSQSAEIVTRDDLPSDPEVLKDMLLEVIEKSEQLAEQLAWFKRNLMGRKSERVTEHPAQESLFPDEDDEEKKPESSKPEKKPKNRPRTKRGGSRKRKRRSFDDMLDSDISVQSRKVSLSDTSCPLCDGHTPYKVIGTDVRRRIEWVPGHFIVDELIVESGVCPFHRKEGIVTAEAPEYIIPGGVFGNTLLCTIIVNKIADNIPLNRQASRFARHGVTLCTSTMSRSLISTAALATHLVSAMREELCDSPWLQGDATSMPVIIGNLGTAANAHLWVYTNGETAVFDISMTKEAWIPAAFLEGFSGDWLSDGTSEYNEVESMSGVTRGGCWSHARRYLFEARKDVPTVYDVLGLIRELFLSEREAVLMDLEDRKKHRQRVARPIIDKIQTWLEEHRHHKLLEYRPKSRFAKAITYLTNQWARLCRFLDCPGIPIHNNRSELLIRNPVIGRKNWLFAGSPAGAESNAVFQSLIASCMLSAIDPQEYLEDVLPRLSAMKPSEVAENTPAQWAKRNRAKGSEELDMPLDDMAKAS